MPIQINAPRVGIARSPYVGNGTVVNLDTSYPGVVKLNYIMVKESATVVAVQVKWIVQHPITSTEVYALGSTGKVYKSTDSGDTWVEMTGNTQTSANGNGLAIWKNYLIVARDSEIDVCGNGTATGIANANWTNSWKTIDTDVDWHPMFVSILDGKLYGGAGRFIFRIAEETTFVPATAATFTYTQQALDLPSPEKIKCIEEIGNNIMVGTWQGSAVNSIRSANIYPWDGSSTSFGQPIKLDEYGVHAMKNQGNLLVVLAGIRGSIYRSNGADAIKIAQLPMELTSSQYIEYYPGAIINWKDKVFFGVGNGGSTAVDGMGTYSIQQTGQGNVLVLEHLISTLSTGSANPLKVSALCAVSDSLLCVGARDNTTYLIDRSSSTSYAYTTDYSGYFDSPLYEVGNDKNKWKPMSMEIRLGRPLRTGEGIRVAYRKDLTTSTFTTIKTIAFTDVGAIQTKTFTTELPDNVKEAEQIQFRVSLLGTNSSTPSLESVLIK